MRAPAAGCQAGDVMGVPSGLLAGRERQLRRQRLPSPQRCGVCTPRAHGHHLSRQRSACSSTWSLSGTFMLTRRARNTACEHCRCSRQGTRRCIEQLGWSLTLASRQTPPHLEVLPANDDVAEGAHGGCCAHQQHDGAARGWQAASRGRDAHCQRKAASRIRTKKGSRASRTTCSPQY